jgi:hypothetical protein
MAAASSLNQFPPIRVMGKSALVENRPFSRGRASPLRPSVGEDPSERPRALQRRSEASNYHFWRGG